MLTFLLVSFKKIYLKNKLKFLELTFLSLFLAFLPSFEAPKNIFLAGYLITALYRQSQLMNELIKLSLPCFVNSRLLPYLLKVLKFQIKNHIFNLLE